MCRGTMVLLVCLLLQAPAMGQTVRSVVDCGGKRLTGAERETCASPDLMRLTTDVDQLTGHLEATLTGRNKEALVDTERPFMVERNNCQNATSVLHQDYASVVHACVERLLRARLDALKAAGTSPGSIVSEIGQYSFWSIPNFVKWGPELLGRHVRLWGCMALDPGPTPASRIHGTIHDYPLRPKGQSVPAIFNTMTEEKATWFYDAKKPCGHWAGVVERRDSSLVLAQIEP
ncbi:MAG: hypothetical protein DMD61_02700 [Gemmatimonadetes bacterium]|nr:MAG: hypothetical protein DMD61_02700 [Gemmatimonadota bacterium]